METLTKMKCVACRKDAPTVTDAELAEFHPQVSDWEIVELDGIQRLRRVFSVDDFAQALEFTNKVGELAEEEGHHPALLTEWGRTTVTWWTHKFFGPHLGIAVVKREVADGWRPYKVRPAPNDPVGKRFETGTLAYELLAGFVAAVEYIESIGWEAIQEHERTLGQRFLDGLPEQCVLYGVNGMDGRVPTFAFNVNGIAPGEAAARLGERGFAVWHGNYYALEVMKLLGLEDGAVRVGFVHYNTTDEVDRLLQELERLE